MHTETYDVQGMHCAACASIVKKTFEKIDGVENAEVNYGTEKAKLSFDEGKTSATALSASIKKLGYSLLIPDAKPAHSNISAETTGITDARHEIHTEHMGIGQSKKAKQEEIAAMQRQVISVIPLALFSIFVMTWDVLVQLKVAAAPAELISEFFHHLLPLMATYTLFVVGKLYLLGLYRFLRYGSANMDTLIGLGTSVAYVYSFILTAFEKVLQPYINTSHSYYDVTIIVITFITLGKYLEARAKLKTGDAIEKLLNLQTKTAIVIRSGHEQEVPLEDVVHGDILLVKPGARIPVDGITTEGNSFVNESMVSGEPMPVKKETGDMVIGGTINTTGSFRLRATKIGSETLLARIIKMVEEAQGTQAPIQGMADKISAVFVPVVLGLAVASVCAWLLIGTSILGFSTALSYGLSCFVAILVIACPCALGLATPTAIIVGVGKGAKEGILIKDAATIEKLRDVNVLVLDKTGTLTNGKPEIVSIENFSTVLREEAVISILASLESNSEHPIAYAITQYAKSKNLIQTSVSHFETIKGKGIRGKVGGTHYFAGNTALVADLGLTFDHAHIEAATLQGKTPIILTTKDQIIALIMISDSVKADARQAVTNLKAVGIEVVMVTGDTKNTANAIAAELGIHKVVAEVLPDQKLSIVKDFQSQGKIVAMAGDGVNDAPALAQADVGIAMGTGTDVAIETAGITLLHGDISKLVKAINLSRLTMRGIKQNLFWAFIYNVIGIPLAAGLLYPIFGWLLNPVFAGLAMAFSSVSVVGNSLRLKAKKI